MLSESPFNLSRSRISSVLCISVSLFMYVCTTAESSLELLVQHERHSRMALWSGMVFLEALTLHLRRNTSIPVLQKSKFSHIFSSSLQPPASFLSQNLPSTLPSSLTAYHIFYICILILSFIYSIFSSET